MQNVVCALQEYARVDLQKVIASLKVNLQKMITSTKAGLQKVVPSATIPCQTNAAATPSVEATTDESSRQQLVASAESSGPTQWAKPQTRILHISSLCLFGEEEELSLVVGFTVKILDWITPTIAVFLVKKASSQPTVSAKSNVKKASTSPSTEGEVDVVNSGESVSHAASVATMTFASPATHPLITPSSFDEGSVPPFVLDEALSDSEVSGLMALDIEGLIAEAQSTSLPVPSFSDLTSKTSLGSIPLPPSFAVSPSILPIAMPVAPIHVPSLGPLPIPPPPAIAFDNKEDGTLPGVAELLLLIPLLEHRVSDSMATVPLVKQVVPVHQAARVASLIEFQDEEEERGVLLAISMKGEGRGAVSMLISDSQDLHFTSGVKCVCPVTLDNTQPSSLLAVCQRGMVTLLSTEKWNVVGCYVDQLLSPSHCIFCPDRRELVVVDTEGQAQVLQITVAEEDLAEDIPGLLGMLISAWCTSNEQYL